MIRVARDVLRVISTIALSAVVLDAAVASHLIRPCTDDCTPPRWIATGNMQAARTAHTATLLPSGKVLVVGGRNVGPIDSVEIYDPARGTWHAAAPMSTARVGHTATLLNDGRVLVVGGSTGGLPPGFGRTASAEVYDPASDTWTPTVGMSTPRDWFDAVLLKDGRVLVAGGFGLDTLASAELYDSTTGRWTATGNLHIARYGHTLTLLHDGSVLAARGSGDGDLATTISSAERYDPRTGTWSLAGETGAGSVMHTATLMDDGRVLVAGGNGGGIGGNVVHAVAMIFDPTTGTWTRTKDLRVPRYGHAATILSGGEVLVAGGAYQIGGYPRLEYHLPLPTERYDPRTSTWSRTADLAVARAHATLTLIHDGTVLAAGGSAVNPNYSETTTASSERYVMPYALGERLAVEYFHADYGHYFITTDEPEIASLDANGERSWVRTGRSFTVFDQSLLPLLPLVPVCRFWSNQSFAPKSSHFYTPYPDECAKVKQDPMWLFERNAFYARMPEGAAGARTCPSGTQPLYRAYNSGGGGAPNHRLTTDPAVLDAMIAQGWIMEGEAATRVFACVPAQ